MNTTLTTTTAGKRTRLAVAIVASLTSLTTVAHAAALTDPPSWDQCVYRDLPVAAGVGGILPVNYVPSPELQAVLRGEITVGTDCSVYDLPV